MSPGQVPRRGEAKRHLDRNALLSTSRALEELPCFVPGPPENPPGTLKGEPGEELFSFSLPGGDKDRPRRRRPMHKKHEVLFTGTPGNAFLQGHGSTACGKVREGVLCVS
jgi:hypothetical protein